MADLSQKSAADTIKVVGSDLAGIETNYANVTADGRLMVESDVGSSSAPNIIKSLWQYGCENGRGFTVATPHITVSSTDEADLALFVNPIGSGRPARVNFLDYLFEPLAEGKNSDIKVYRDPTVSVNGTSVSIKPIRKGQAESSVMSFYYSPTITSRGTQLLYNWGTNNGFVTLPSELGLFVEPGEKWLFTVQTSTGNREHAISVRWVEL